MFFLFFTQAISQYKKISEEISAGNVLNNKSKIYEWKTCDSFGLLTHKTVIFLSQLTDSVNVSFSNI